MSGQDWLSIWVIFKSPDDFPGEFVVREQRITAGVVSIAPEIHARGASLEDVRQMIPPGLYRLDRHPEDPPCVVETWT